MPAQSWKTKQIVVAFEVTLPHFIKSRSQVVCITWLEKGFTAEQYVDPGSARMCQVEYARQLAPPGTEAKMQALVNGLFFNVAMAAGSLIWGFLAQRPPNGLGFTRCFWLDAVLIVAWLAVWRGGWEIALRRGWT
ncbi:unnamed protein product [Polarella glacialis]|uniref:Uncharacterized protein n=1 Tax=Polarella glacialis TaxID=89957 RepID=A0A813HA37_POLGL|nr:unnamed protein product [Polarella glacialis]